MQYPLSSNQKKLWRHFEFYPEDPSYNVAFLYKITGDLDRGRLKKAIELVCNQIDLFKVRFRATRQEYVAERYNEVQIVFRKSDESPEEFEARVLADSQALLNSAIDLTEWPLLHFTLYVASADECYLASRAPHIISDGVSYFHLIDAINEAYRDLSGEKVYFTTSFLDLKEEPFDPRDLEFFEEELDGVESFEIKAIKQERNAQGSFEGSFHHFSLPKDRISHYLKRYGFSENQFFLAIHALLLNKCTEQTQIAIGFPVLNRTKTNRKVFGYFVNTLPLVLTINSKGSFHDLLSETQGKVLRLLRHQSFDMARLDKIEGRFNTFFTFYNRELNYSLGDCACERIYLPRKGLTSEFTFTVESRSNDYVIAIEAGQFFESVDLQSVVMTMIGAVLEQDNPPVRSIPLVADRSIEIDPYRGPLSIAAAFGDVVAQYPHRIALDDFKSQMTYEELDKKSNQIARVLWEKTPDSPFVMLSVARSNNLVALILGIIKAGKAYVPIDIFCPKERFNYIYNQLSPALLITDQTEGNGAQERLMPLDLLLEEAREHSDGALIEMASGDDLAYIIFTSGTTGVPKGVQISHRNLLSLIAAAFAKFAFDERDVWTLFHSYSFDFSVWEIFGCLLSGGRLLVIDSETAKRPSEFYQIVADFGVTVLNQTPTAFGALMRADEELARRLNLRYVIFGGESLYARNLKEWAARHPLTRTKMVNMYGITETTIHVTYHEVSEEDLESVESVVGQPLKNLAANILSGKGEILPPGLCGEIAICGEGLSCGYYKAGDLTAQKFVMREGKRFYLSGDLAKIDERGRLIFMGRKDRQVQVRGFRVELDEIEFHLLKTGLVQQCAIDALRFEGDTFLRVIAYAVPKNGGFHEMQIKERLKASLPFYMIPSLFFPVKELPLTVNGKVDLTRLKKQIHAPGSEKVEGSMTEKRLCELIAQTIKKGPFSLEDNFWDIGMNSIDLASLFFTIKTEFGLKEMSMAHLFHHTTVKKLAHYIERSRL